MSDLSFSINHHPRRSKSSVLSLLWTNTESRLRVCHKDFLRRERKVEKGRENGERKEEEKEEERGSFSTFRWG